MKWRISLFGATTLFLGLCSSGFGVQKANRADPPLVPFCSLVANPQAYEGKEVKVRASYRYGFEWQEIFCQPCRNVGKTWLELNEDREPYYKAALKKFPKHQGTVNAIFTGTFHSSKGAYGDGGYRFQFIVTAISDPEVVSKRGWDPANLPENSRRKACGVSTAARHLLPARRKSACGGSTARDGTRTTQGVAYTSYYFDQDGDGNFETPIDGGPRLSVPA